MQLNMALDLLHRRIEEWTEEAMIEPDTPTAQAEGFREFGSELVAYLHEAAEKMEMTVEELMIPENDAENWELCDEIAELLLDEWAMIDFAERPAGVELDELRPLLVAVADVLEAPADDCAPELEEANEMLDEFLMEVYHP